MKCEKPISENQKALANKLYKLFKESDVLTKEQMFEYLGWDKSKDRQLRDTISIIAQRKPIISTSDKKGYKLAKDENDLREVEHSYADLSSRCEELTKRMQPLIKFRDKYKWGIE